MTSPALPADRASTFFDDSEVREIRLYFDDPNWYDTLYQAHDNDPEDPYFPARFQYGDTVLPKIGARFKGHASFRRNGVKKPFKLDFNEYDDDANFLGLKKLNLHNGDLQPAHLHEKLFLDFAGNYIAAMRAVHVRLYVNDAYYGLYLAVEQPDKTMMQSRFGADEDGNLWEGGENVPANLSYLGPDPAAYYSRYELKTNESANDYSALISMLDILNDTPAEELPAKLEPIMDIENVMSGMALNALFTNFESYLGTASEYYLYQRSSDNRFVHIHWDTNESFGSIGDGTPRIQNVFTYEPFTIPTSQLGVLGEIGRERPLLDKTWAVPEYKRLYLRLLARFLREGFDEDTFSARAHTLADRFREAYRDDPNTPYNMTQFEMALDNQVTHLGFTTYGIAQFVRERRAHLRPYLDALADVSDLRLNEIVAMNDGSYRDEAGDADPWVEIYNPGPGPVSTGGFYLSDDPGNPMKWALPARTLADGEFLVLWLDGETAEGDTHVSFTLSSGEGSLYLYHAAAAETVADMVAYGAIAGGQSFVRLGLYGSRWELGTVPTPGAENVAPAVDSAPNPSLGNGRLRINEFMADNDHAIPDPDEPGAFEDWLEIYNPGQEDVDMSGMYISDNLNNPTKWQVPAGVVIPAGGYVVFIADGHTDQGILHISWSLSKYGESISLYEADGETLVDRIVFGPQRTDIAMGRTADGAPTWSLFAPSTPGASNADPVANWVLNGAGYQLAPLAPGSIGSAFAEGISEETEAATSLPLPTTLAGVSVILTDSDGTEREAPLYFVSPQQVNFLVPEGTPEGKHVFAIHREGADSIMGDILIAGVAPALFAANADGTGVGAMNVIRVDAGGSQTVIPVLHFDEETGRYVASPISLGEEGDQIYLVLYGTGIRNVANLSQVTATVRTADVPVTFAGAQSEYAGLDQVNIGPLPRSLAGRGEVPVVITVDDNPTNAVTVAIE